MSKSSDGMVVRATKSKIVSRTLILFVLSGLFLLTAAIPLTSVAATSCVPAGGTGLTASMVIYKSYTHVTGKTINAAPCDIGIYVAPGTTGVQISGTTVTGANDHGIMVQDSSNVKIEHNLVTGNGANGGHSCNYIAPPCIPEDKGIQLVGTTNALVAYNIVTHNDADGGIAVTGDNQTFNPAALKPSAHSPHPAVNTWIVGNTVLNNLAGCGIVAAAYDEHAGLENTYILFNTIVGSSPSQVGSGAPPYVGQIVIATDGQFTYVTNTLVYQNQLEGSLLPGIVVHSNVFGDKILYTKIIGNTIADNGFYPPSFSTGSNDPGPSTISVGIALIAEVGVQPPHTPNPVLAFTTLRSNTILNDNIGVWRCNAFALTITNLLGNPTHKVVSCP